MAYRDDPYKSLEDLESQASLDFAHAANQACLKALGDPAKSKNASASYSKILEVLESDERIPFVSKMSKDDAGEDLLYNLWKDSKVRLLPFNRNANDKIMFTNFPNLFCYVFNTPRTSEDYGVEQQ